MWGVLGVAPPYGAGVASLRGGGWCGVVWIGFNTNPHPTRQSCYEP